MFVYTLKLDTNLMHHHQLSKRFKMADDIYQKTLRQILKRTRHQKKRSTLQKSLPVTKRN